MYTEPGKKRRRDDRAALRKRPGGEYREFIALATIWLSSSPPDRARATAEELWRQKSPDKSGKTLDEEKDDLSNRIREVFNLARIVRFDGTVRRLCASQCRQRRAGRIRRRQRRSREGYRHAHRRHAAAGASARKNSTRPTWTKSAKSFREAARKEGKPENIIAKMVEGRLRNFYAERVLLEQPFVKDDKKTVGQLAKDAKLKIKKLVHWELGK